MWPGGHTGHGKTTLYPIKHLRMFGSSVSPWDFVEPEDTHEDFAEWVDERADDLIWIDPTDDRPPAVNILSKFDREVERQRKELIKERFGSPAEYMQAQIEALKEQAERRQKLTLSGALSPDPFADTEALRRFLSHRAEGRLDELQRRYAILHPEGAERPCDGYTRSCNLPASLSVAGFNDGELVYEGELCSHCYMTATGHLDHIDAEPVEDEGGER